jgi:hypothetical protein
LTRCVGSVNHRVVIRSAWYLIRCAFVAALSLSFVTARPMMPLAHADTAPVHGCSMHMTHGAPHSGHRCPAGDAGSCCDDCLCGCIIGTGFTKPALALVALESATPWTLPTPVAAIRPRRSPALRLPPPIGPPASTRS